MKLVYLWVENYKCFNGLEIKFIPTKKVGDFFDIEEPSHLFKSIDTVSCFIGKNGVGKSTLIEILIKAFSGDLLETEFQLIFANDKDFYSLSNGKERIFGNNLVRVSKLDKRITKNCSVSFYSPIYNPHNTLKYKKNASVINVSSDSLYKSSKSISRLKDTKLQFDFLSIMDSFASSSLSFDKYFQVENNIPNLGTIKRLFRKEFERLRISKSKKDVEILNDFLRELEFIGIDRNILAHFESRSSRFDVVEFFNEVDIVFENIQKSYADQKNDMHLEKQIILDFVLLRAIKIIKRRDEQEGDLKSSILSMILRVGRTGDFEELVKRFENGSIIDKDEIYALKKFCKALTRNGYQKMPIPIEVSMYEEFFKIVSIVKEMSIEESFIKYSWRGISSGQLAKLNLYSRIFHSIQSNAGSNCLVMLDEADVFLHPEWQVNFFLDLEKFFKEIKKIFPGIVIDLLVTTHSPLVLTDIFKESVFEIKQNRQKSLIKNTDKNTFASNIYDLYENEFKVSNVKGKFASSKINNLIESIQSKKELTEADYNLFNNIGEPILKRSILSLMEKNGNYR